jgi:hypothetical protein
MAELDLLVEYVSQLQYGLEQAERLTRDGELARAMWAYLAVLEVDPDNPVARRQVGQVATAVRQFDRTAPGRRWLLQLRGEKLPPEEGRPRRGWLRWLLIFLFALAAFGLGYMTGSEFWPDLEWIQLPEITPPDSTMGGKP